MASGSKWQLCVAVCCASWSLCRSRHVWAAGGGNLREERKPAMCLGVAGILKSLEGRRGRNWKEKGWTKGSEKLGKNIIYVGCYTESFYANTSLFCGEALPFQFNDTYTLLYSYIRIVYHFYLSPVVNSVVAEPSSQFTQMTNLPVFAVPLSLRQLFCQSVCRKTSSKIPCFPIWRASCCTTSILTRQQNSPRLPGLTAAQ